MNDTSFEFIYYVADVANSCAFYSHLFGCEPVESYPHFAMYKLKSGCALGLWAKADVEPAIPSQGTNSELVFKVESKDKVDAIHKRWHDEKIRIAQPPTAMDFGYTFTALDPDGNRIRVFSMPAK